MHTYLSSLLIPSFLMWIASLSSYVLLSVVAPLSHSVAKITERMILILVAIHVFKTSISSENTMGIFIAFFGIGAFYCQTSRTEKAKILTAKNEKSDVQNGIALVDITTNGQRSAV